MNSEFGKFVDSVAKEISSRICGLLTCREVRRQKNLSRALQILESRVKNIEDLIIKPTDTIIPSEEQKAIIEACSEGHNIQVQAVAGSGKTTTLFLCAERCPEKKFLLLTYNKKLQEDIAEKLITKKLDNVVAMTYHGAASYAYMRNVRNDNILLECLKTPIRKVFPKLACDVLLLDEMQDTAIQTYLFIVKMVQKMSHKPQYVVVGDIGQAINEYMGARAEFLVACHKLFDSGRTWMSLTLSTSFRLTPSMATFVNTHVLHEDVIVGGNRKHEDIKPLYVSTGFGGISTSLENSVRYAVETYGAENVAVLAPSIRVSAKNPIYNAIKNLSDIPTYTHTKDSDFVSEKEIFGKLIFMTFNSMKGCERDCVIVLNFSESYFKYFDSAWSHPTRVPNVLYVAATRARQELILITEHDKTLRTVRVDKLKATTRLSGKHFPKNPAIVQTDPDLSKPIPVTDLIRHQPFSSTFRMLSMAAVVAERRVECPAHLPQFFVQFGELWESVANLYGTVIPVLVELDMTGSCEGFDQWSNPIVVKTIKERDSYRGMPVLLESDIDHYPEGFWTNARRIADTAPYERSIGDWFVLSVAKNAIEEGKHHLARQISHYDWIDEEFVAEAKRNVVTTLEGKTGQFEKLLPTYRAGPRRICGRADYIDGKGSMWEFKCVKEISDDHILQTGCYLAMNGGGVGYVYGFAGGQILTIQIQKDACSKFMQLAIEKYDKLRVRSDIGDDIQQFIKVHNIPMGDAPTEDQIGEAFDWPDDSDFQEDPTASDSVQFSIDDVF